MVDLTRLINNDTRFKEETNKVEERYRCDWDDVVHDSYLRYVRQQKERAESIHSIRCKAESIVKEVEELKINDMLAKAKALCEETSSL